MKGVVFKFTRAKGDVYTNRVFTDDIVPIAIPADFTTVSKSNPIIFTWEGAPIENNEEVQITITSENIGSNFFYATQTGATSINIEFITPVKSGQVAFSLSRIKTLPIQESNGTAGGEIKVAYTVSKTINIE